MSRRFAAPIALLCTLVLFLAACGDDGGDDAADDTTTTAAEAEADDTTTTTAAEDDGETDEADETTTTEASGGGDVSDEAAALLAADDFCDLWTTAEGSPTMSLDDVDTTGGPEAMEESFALIQAFLARGAQLAPDDIRADYLLVAGSTSELFELLEQYEFDFTAMAQASAGDPELQAKFNSLDTPEMEAAIANVEGWVETNCR